MVAQGSLFQMLFAIGFVFCCAFFVGMAFFLLMHRAESPDRKIQKRLRELKGAEENVPVSNHEAARSSGNFMNQLVGIMDKLSHLPVARVFAKPLAARLKEQKLQALRDSCMNDLPEMVDILSLALGAGLSIDQAFEWYLSNYDTPLAGEFRRAEQRYQVGMLSRMKAFEQLAESLQEEAVLRFVNALRQAFTLGSALGPALDVLSQDVRRYRVSRIEERIAKTPVKILAPLGLCIVPAVLILLMGPIMSQVLQGFQL